MSQEITLKRARGIAFKMLGFRARTCHQVRAALLKKGAPEALAAEVIDELLEAGYLNDREFAQNYLSVRLEQKAHGRRYYLAKLCQAGVDTQLAKEVLEEVYTKHQEEEQAIRFVERLRQRGETCPQKILRKLANRGFSASVSRSALNEENYPPE
ncbi:regulatory protein RecX [Dethiobacter alkaliphilus]|uniref:Regulatory protein RecX n=1 Tax=Dethiobacter alkaliphilus AHT 1 TaxID=555088 RepID=C0GDM8_DETAL|nr:regulatory protein RecX [Dethiobacter alkaliphilus]EEG78511.1 regulatory protein RecX [Dethiobacter alkaliphilus AHT 1]